MRTWLYAFALATTPLITMGSDETEAQVECYRSWCQPTLVINVCRQSYTNPKGLQCIPINGVLVEGRWVNYLDTTGTELIQGGFVASTAKVETLFENEDIVVVRPKITVNARIFGYAEVTGDAEISGEAMVYGYAKISNQAVITDRAQIFGYSHISMGTIGGDTWAANAILRDRRASNINKTMVREIILPQLSGYKFPRNNDRERKN